MMVMPRAFYIQLQLDQLLLYCCPDNRIELVRDQTSDILSKQCEKQQVMRNECRDSG